MAADIAVENTILELGFEQAKLGKDNEIEDHIRRLNKNVPKLTAEYIYKQVITQLQETKEIQEYASTYSQMKPKQAAGIFEKMTGDSDLRLVARILNAMNAESRGAILGVMDPEIAARLTKIMDPES